MVYLSSRTLAPHWVTLPADSKAVARAAVKTYVAELKHTVLHTVGMHGVYFILAAQTLFS